ncbi:MAG: flavodoxin-dependent (E)-4-hydroxy-3-methylbut-2-enyl-diphosphate synthase, partial [Kiritimatiellae bacterium]|nr:flavodoxin-dependent (E)-4-hydroxy-3-methylbut-2-enyl-diphosphate synthase [Kiritimatiellia bacterium]
SAAIGILLAEGVGDTIRVSLTAPPVEEVRAGLALLRALGLRGGGADVTSCPTCGRTRCDLFGTAAKVESALEALYRGDPDLPRPRVAVMGCVVNGPGEARDADFALVGGEKEFFLYARGERLARFPEEEAVGRLVEAVRSAARNARQNA